MADPVIERPAALGLRQAADRVVAGWDESGFAALGEDRVEPYLARVVEALDGGAALDSLPDDDAGATLCRRLLECLRAELIGAWSAAENAPDSADMLRLLQRVERARETLEPDPDDDSFISRLLGPNGLDLVVEVAHDLRSPLTSILFLSETLRRGQSGDINEVQHRQLGLVYSAALGLVSIVGDIIELARGGDRLSEGKPRAFSIAANFESVRNIVRPMAEEKGLKLRLLPPDTDDRIGHPVPLSRVLLNLTTNALKFTQEGSVEITARATGPTGVEFSVRDTGPGIDPQARQMLYQPFRESEAREGGQYFSGTGLGLTIARKLVRAMGSTLELETEPEWGTRFFFELDLPPAAHL